ncbi:ABC transporter ATP-binding protein [Enterococcus saccharolyticus]|uniref:ABC transporter ATP-binding protein n=1 Tax=Enterococcus saccharolyticus TaxID=41997 RepID=UPI001E2F8CD1|nr:ABC transporter ATP-binding protein [Enterococcus saccharolyticus]MCD5001230.1 ABC transporter ATP-binding protein [Enterococcus saccharolyticus]
MAILTFEDVSFIRKQQALLNHISWQINEGENWGILGLNGAGKTLLLQLITGSLWPYKGRLTVLDQVFGQTSIPELSKRIGWVSTALQYRLNVNDTAERIVLSGKFASIGIYQKFTQEDLNTAKEILVSLDAESLIGKNYHFLSQGERQIVLIARALMAEPELLILDEPCNGLDLFAREELLIKIDHLMRQPDAPGLLFVTHHTEEILPIISHVMMLKNGEIFAKGLREEMMTEALLPKFYDKPITMYALSEQRKVVLPANHLN